MRTKGTLSSTSNGRPRQLSSPYNVGARLSVLRGGRGTPAEAAARAAQGSHAPAGGRAASTPRSASVGRQIVRVTPNAADDPLSGGDYIKVGGGTVPRNLAGLIQTQVASAVGMGAATAPIVAVGPASVNQAIKGLAIARKALEPSRTDFVFLPSFVRLESDDLNAIQLDVRRAHTRVVAEMDGMELRAAGSTDIKGLAGAVAKNARDMANSFICAVGASAVNQAVKAVAIARTYLAEEALDLHCRATIDDIDEGELAGKTAISIIIEPVGL
jgi:stage V sporulation protein S